MATVTPIRRSARNGAAPVEQLTRTVILVDLDRVDIGPNVRVNVEGIDELADSIRAHGVLQPIKVRAAGDRWIVVWGQRRVLAARLAGEERIPALTTADEPTARQLAAEQLVENLHHADLNPMDRARAIRAVVDAGVSQADLARELGLAPSTIANDLRLLGIDEEVQAKVEAGEISPSHARTIASLPPKQQRELAERVTREKLSTHDLEREIQWKQDAAAREAKASEKTERWIPKAIAALEAAGIPKSTSVDVYGGWQGDGYYSLDAKAIAKAVAAAGWKTTSDPGMAKPDRCDCTVVRLEVGGRKAEITPRCIDVRHRDRQVNLEHLERKKAEALWDAQNAQVIEALVPVLRSIPVGLLRLLYHRNERCTGRYARWEETAALTGEQLVAMSTDHFRNTFGMRDIDQTAVLRELGIEPASLDEPEPEPTAGEEPTRDLAIGDPVMVAGAGPTFEVVGIKGSVVTLKAPDRGRRVVARKQLEWQARDEAWQFNAAKA